MKIRSSYPVGLGLRRELIDALQASFFSEVSFLEVAPENWIDIGGNLGKKFSDITERYPIICHGLSLSLGGVTPLNRILLKKIKLFLKEHSIDFYSEHLSYCGDKGYLHDLLPIPFTEKTVKHVAGRIRKVQDFLERPIAIENISYYVHPPTSKMTELEFILRVVEESRCKLLLDVNNVYVNSVNHGYDPVHFIRSIPPQSIAYLHVAGHHHQSKNLIIDTHGAPIVDPVWDLLKETYQSLGFFPTLIERDFNIPPLEELLKEVRQVRLMGAKKKAV